jgi:antitoxin ParD1/3/4
MSLALKPEFQKFIDDQVKAGRYDSAEEVVEAGLAILEQQNDHGDFAPGELDRLLAEGAADIERGDVYDGEAVFRELDELSAARRRGQTR